MNCFLGFVVCVVLQKPPWRHMTPGRVLGAVPVVGVLWSLECVRSTGAAASSCDGVGEQPLRLDRNGVLQRGRREVHEDTQLMKQRERSTDRVGRYAVLSGNADHAFEVQEWFSCRMQRVKVPYAN